MKKNIWQFFKCGRGSWNKNAEAAQMKHRRSSGWNWWHVRGRGGMGRGGWQTAHVTGSIWWGQATVICSFVSPLPRRLRLSEWRQMKCLNGWKTWRGRGWGGGSDWLVGGGEGRQLLNNTVRCFIANEEFMNVRRICRIILLIIRVTYKHRTRSDTSRSSRKRRMHDNLTKNLCRGKEWRL